MGSQKTATTGEKKLHLFIFSRSGIQIIYLTYAPLTKRDVNHFTPPHLCAKTHEDKSKITSPLERLFGIDNHSVLGNCSAVQFYGNLEFATCIFHRYYCKIRFAGAIHPFTLKECAKQILIQFTPSNHPLNQKSAKDVFLTLVTRKHDYIIVEYSG